MAWTVWERCGSRRTARRRRGPGSLVVLVVLVVPASACASDGGGSAPSGPIVWDSAGVTIVESRDPQWPSGEAWCVAGMVTQVGGRRSEPAHELYRALDATRLSDGTVVVANSGTGELRFFDGAGNHVRTVGSTDGGPGEFRGANALRALQRVRGDTLVAWDLYAQALSVFSSDGRFVRSAHLDDTGHQLFFGGMYEDRSLLMRAYQFEEGRGEGLPEGIVRDLVLLLRFGPDLLLQDSLGGIPTEERFEAEIGPFSVISASAPLGRITTIGVTGSSTFVATGDAYEIRLYDGLASLRTMIRRVVPPVRVTAAQVDAHRREPEQAHVADDERLPTEVRRRYATLPYPETLPPYGAVVADDRGDLWVEVYPVLADDPAVWSVFARGVWQGDVTLPQGLEPLEIGDDYVLGRAKDVLGIERIEVHALRKDGACP